MRKRKTTTNDSTLKWIIAPIILVLGGKILHYWLSDATAWGLGAFGTVLFLHLIPPRSPLDVIKVIALAATVAILMYGITRIVG